MGRWLEKIANMPNTIVTKQTEPSFVGYVTTNSVYLHKINSANLNLIEQSNIAEIAIHGVTEQTELCGFDRSDSCVSFVTTDSASIQKTKPILIDFVTRCCNGLKADPQQVIDHLLSDEDEKDIISGAISFESLWLSIDLWLSSGKPMCSGKN